MKIGTKAQAIYHGNGPPGSYVWSGDHGAPQELTLHPALVIPLLVFIENILDTPF